MFPSRVRDSPHLGTRQYVRVLEDWVEELRLDSADYDTHSMRRTSDVDLSAPQELAWGAVAAWALDRTALSR